MGQATEIIDRVWATMESGQIESLDDLVAPDGEVQMPGGVTLRGPGQLVPLLRAYVAAFPDLRHEVIDAVESAAGDSAAIELRVTGTHTGAFQTPGGEIPATGKPVVWESVDMVHVANGKITSWHAFFDQVAFLQQLGLMSTPQAATVA